ncbi:choline transporter [Extremus antarcticus]|uniref:Choline transporter n=1 Tax=Extremus antarcticus TaxID=702011 RepID=A0AAJ0GJJ8_9PEZI|nr:choline transporter [Extremus antarcticus]
MVTVPSVTPEYKPASFVFATFINNTGYDQAGIAFIVGLINTNWPFCCLDCATHLAEEVPRPERNIPIAICGTVAIGFTTAWFFAVAMFFSLYGDFEQLVNTETGVPILVLFYSALTGRSAQVAGAIVLESLILATGLGCQIASHTWQSRLLWSFARDGGVPFSRYFAHCSEKLDVPLRAHLFSCGLVAIVGSLYLGSYTAFNSMVTATIVLLYISYAVPIFSLLFVRGRNNLRHGPFWLGKVGMVANVVVLCWTMFTLVMYSFPYTMPVQAGNMNYVSAVYAAVSLIVAADWFLRGKKQYGNSKESRQTLLAEVVHRRASVGSTEFVH